MEEALHHCVFKEEINLVYNTFACFHVLRPDLWTAGEKPPGTVSSFICVSLSLFTSDSDLADQNQRVIMKAMRMKTHLAEGKGRVHVHVYLLMYQCRAEWISWQVCSTCQGYLTGHDATDAVELIQVALSLSFFLFIFLSLVHSFVPHK